MKNILPPILSCLLITSIGAQNIDFTPAALPAPQNFTEFDGVSLSSSVFSDIDGDNDQDVLITGYNNLNEKIAKLYQNDGTGNFSEKLGTPFEGVYRSSISFADVDGDNDQDVLITGLNALNQPIAKLYQNDGIGNFSEVLGTPFEPVYEGSIAFSDIDGDNDQDLLITGNAGSSQYIAKLYKNDGAGNFTEDTSPPFTGVHRSSISFADVDGDNDQDVLITGYASPGGAISKLFKNDGTGNFSEVIGTPFEGVYYSSIAFADVDGDNDQDVLITGDGFGYITKLYKNDGVGNFTEVTGTTFENVYYSSVEFSDIDNDSDQDVLITGLGSGNQKIAKLYQNDGIGNYTEITSTNFTGVQNGSVAFADANGDSFPDLLITGGISSLSPKVSNYYLNDGFGQFIEITGNFFKKVHSSASDFADVDNDGDLDLLISGETYKSYYNRTCNLYLNDGLGNFSLDVTASFPGVYKGSIAFKDIDGDNDQDVLITGLDSNNQPLTNLYKNDGSGNFTLVLVTPFVGVFASSVAFEDIDGDFDPDLIICGNTGAGSITKLYKNDGSGNFSVFYSPCQGLFNSSVAFADIDQDGDNDVLITGSNGSEGKAYLFKNDGSGNFSFVSGTPFVGVSASSVAFEDIDGDNDQDILVTGWISTNLRISKLYTNDGTGSYSEVIGTPFEAVYYGGVDFSDVDGDNDQDVIISGDAVSGRISKIYENDGSGNFSEAFNLPIAGTWINSVIFADVDNDFAPDLLLTGFNDLKQPSAKLYSNITCNPSAGTDNIHSCNSFTWVDGVTYTSSNNTATHTFINSYGCTRTVQLDLTINYSNTGSDIITACDSITWIDGVTYTTNNNSATHTISTVNGCDSLVTLDLTIINSTNGTDTRSECNSYTWIDGATYTSSNNSATFNILNGGANGCDSLVTLDLTIINSANGTDTRLECNSFLWIDGTTYTSSNNSATFNIVNGSANGCDSLVALDLTIINNAIGTDTQTECNSFLWIDGNTYTSSNNIATFNIIGGAINGCDSIVTLDLTIFNSTLGTDTRTECNSYTWIDGNIYNSNNNTATFNIVNGASNGCDSLVTLDLTIINSANGIETRTECNTYIWIDGNTYNANNNTATFNIVNGAANGCDSLVTLDLTIFNSTTGIDTRTECDSYTWIDGNTYNSNNNTATFNIVNGAFNGCDSTVTLNLTIINSTSGTDTRIECNSYTWIDGNTYITNNNIATYNISGGAANGCDSTVTLDLTITTVDTTVTQNGNTLTANQANASYQWYNCGALPIINDTNQIFTSSANGSYSVEITQNGCSEMSSCYNTISTVGLSENSSGVEFSLYPNPSTGKITLIAKMHANINIYTMLGAAVLEQTISQGVNSIDLSNQPNGIYFITIESENNSTILPIVIEK